MFADQGKNENKIISISNKLDYLNNSLYPFRQTRIGTFFIIFVTVLLFKATLFKQCPLLGTHDRESNRYVHFCVKTFEPAGVLNLEQCFLLILVTSHGFREPIVDLPVT
jgi:hypothetical protein